MIRSSCCIPLVRSDYSQILWCSAEEYDTAIARANAGNLVVMAVWSEANPICIATEPKIQRLAAEHKDAEFYKMHLNSETQPMIKFGVQNTPIFILAQGHWARTVLGANLRMLEDALNSRTS